MKMPDCRKLWNILLRQKMQHQKKSWHIQWQKHRWSRWPALQHQAKNYADRLQFRNQMKYFVS